MMHTTENKSGSKQIYRNKIHYSPEVQVDDVVAVIGNVRTLPPILLHAQAGLAAAQRLQGFQLEAYVVVGILDNLHRQRAAYGIRIGFRLEAGVCRGVGGGRDKRRERKSGWVEVERWEGGGERGQGHGRRGGERQKKERERERETDTGFSHSLLRIGLTQQGTYQLPVSYSQAAGSMVRIIVFLPGLDCFSLR